MFDMFGHLTDSELHDLWRHIEALRVCSEYEKSGKPVPYPFGTRVAQEQEKIRHEADVLLSNGGNIRAVENMVLKRYHRRIHG